jgi:hypothetical protein
MRRVASRTERLLDEDATVERVAEQQLWMPVMRARPERWLEIALVVEESFEMWPWARTIQELRSLLAHSGAFRDVRMWRLASAAGSWRLLSAGALRAGAASRRAEELLDAAGRRAVLVVSDCSSPIWRDAEFSRTLKMWGSRQPVAIVQLLPQRLWTSTALRDARGVRVRSRRPGSPNAKFAMEAVTRQRSAKAFSGLPVPIVTLEKASVAAWAQTTAAADGAWTHARLFPPLTSEPLAPRSAEQAWKDFHETASPVAQELARLLAAAPLTLPVMRLVQRTMLPQSRQVHLAEIFRGELLEVAEKAADPELLRYDFQPGIRVCCWTMRGLRIRCRFCGRRFPNLSARAAGRRSIFWQCFAIRIQWGSCGLGRKRSRLPKWRRRCFRV